MRGISIAVLIVVSGLALACSGYMTVQSTPPDRPAPTVVHEVETTHPAHLGIPPGHLPPPGQCKIWVPGRPPGHQGPSGNCSELRASAPAGSWLVYRPSHDRKHVEVSVYDVNRPRLVVSVALYDANSGRFVRDLQ